MIVSKLRPTKQVVHDLGPFVVMSTKFNGVWRMTRVGKKAIMVSLLDSSNSTQCFDSKNSDGSKYLI